MRPFVPPLRTALLCVAAASALAVFSSRVDAGLIAVTETVHSGQSDQLLEDQAQPFFNGGQLRWSQYGSDVRAATSDLAPSSVASLSNTIQAAKPAFRDDWTSGSLSVDGVDVPAVVARPIADRSALPNVDPVVSLPPTSRGIATAIPLLPACWSGAIGCAAIALANGAKKFRRLLR